MSLVPSNATTRTRTASTPAAPVSAQLPPRSSYEDTGGGSTETAWQKTQRIIQDGYERAKRGEQVSFADIDGREGLDISAVIANDGTTQRTLPLPNGETINAQLGIGLPDPCANPRLFSIEKDDEGRGLWLTITGENKGDLVTTHVLLTLKENVTHKEALVCYGSTRDRALTPIRMREGYEGARKEGHVSFTEYDNGEGLDISAVIANDGTTQMALPLPNGATIKAKLGIGLPQPCTNPRLLSIEKDDEGRGLWLTITGENKGDLVTTHVLLTLKENVTHKEALVCYGSTRDRALTPIRMREGYERAKTKGHVSFTEYDNREGLDISAVIANNGVTQMTLPLPNGETIKKALGIGLPEPCTNPRLLSIEKDDEGRGLWLTITGENKGDLVTTHVLLTLKENVTHKEALVCYGSTRDHALTPIRIREGYERARKEGHVSFTEYDNWEGLDISAVIANDGRTQNSLPLPNGETIKKALGIGLPSPCTKPRLLSIDKDVEGKGLWLTITAKNKEGGSVTTHVLLTLKEKVTGTEALVCYGSTTDRALTPIRIREGYERAQTNGHVSFTAYDNWEGLDISAVIANNGKTQRTLPLPNGERIKDNLGIGLPKSCTNPRLLSITHDKENNLYKLHIRATDENTDQPREVTLVLKGERGLTKEDAIHSHSSDRSDALPPTFRNRIKAGRDTAKKLTTRASRKSDVAGSIAYAKGQCFEQLIGVLLATEYPEERVLPQYCLRVDAEKGYYGMRVDFKVGEKLFEVKWGNATQNIQETYEAHTKVPGVDSEQYNLITLCPNNEISVPYSLFSTWVGRNSLRKELNDAMARISRFVSLGEEAKHDEETKRNCSLNLEVIRNYLYDAFHRVGTNKKKLLVGDKRIDSLRAALRRLNDTPDENIARELSKISHHWSPLEAYWEFEGQIRRNLILFHELVREDPDAYDLGFCYYLGVYYTDESPDARDADTSADVFPTFREIEDIKLLTILTDMSSSDGTHLYNIPKSITVQGVKDEHGWFTKPIFTVSVGDTTFSVSRHDVEGGCTYIKDMSDLGHLAEQHGLIPPPDMGEIEKIIEEFIPDLEVGAGEEA